MPIPKMITHLPKLNPKNPFISHAITSPAFPESVMIETPETPLSHIIMIEDDSNNTLINRYWNLRIIRKILICIGILCLFFGFIGVCVMTIMQTPIEASE